MSEDKTASFTLTGPVAAVIAIVVLIVRLATIGSVSDPGLEASIRAELANDLGEPAMAATREMMESGDVDVEEIAALVDRDNIRLYSVSVSKPLFSIGSTEKAIVHFVYELPGQAEQETYWRFSHGAIGGWHYRGQSSAISYYLNFL